MFAISPAVLSRSLKLKMMVIARAPSNKKVQNFPEASERGIKL
jgi:hypothetical protein